MKKSIFTLTFLGFIFAGCSSKPLTITSVDYISEVEKKIKTVYFDFDKSFIRDDQWGTVISNSNVLNKGRIQAHNFVIEGHCDEWGTDEYNYALGLKRAKPLRILWFKKALLAQKEFILYQKARVNQYVKLILKSVMLLIVEVRL